MRDERAAARSAKRGSAAWASEASETSAAQLMTEGRARRGVSAAREGEAVRQRNPTRATVSGAS
jgi:hypothetical protein